MKSITRSVCVHVYVYRTFSYYYFKTTRMNLHNQHHKSLRNQPPPSSSSLFIHHPKKYTQVELKNKYKRWSLYVCMSCRSLLKKNKCRDDDVYVSCRKRSPPFQLEIIIFKSYIFYFRNFLLEKKGGKPGFDKVYVNFFTNFTGKYGFSYPVVLLHLHHTKNKVCKY